MLPKITSASGREFTCFPAAIVVFLINEQDEVLLLSKDPGRWEVISGAIEDDETILEAAQRELREETGDAVRADPVGVVHAHRFHYDEGARNLISIHYVMRYKEGDILPGDDMAGATFAWWSLGEIDERLGSIAIPMNQFWLFDRAIALARMFEEQPANLEYAVDSDH